ncbi:glycoside hydrolase family 3 protein [Microbacterium kribbense]|uniref:beta-N-acetylhexosaminidase n=1 Tax=Microbacterium kribbense TaxID=433645 RepID=A0ABP7G153_9MICO
MRIRIAAGMMAGLALLAGCAAAPAASPTTPTTASATSTPTPTPTVDPIADLSLAQRVGQLFMVGTGTDAPNPQTLADIADRHVGGIFLHSGTASSVAQTAAVVARFTALVSPAATGDVPLWVATDQEGGDVQVLHGPGFARMPSALTQGTRAPETLRADAASWAAELAAAGVNVNLAPVADIVTSAATARQNPPIGALDRQYGYDQQTVAAHAGGFADGMRHGGVMPTFKHFPGLGRARTNTDFVLTTDTTVTAGSPDVQVYRALLAAGPALVMAATAIYQKIDPSAPAAFSPKIITGLLRGTLGFDGVVITDDLSAAAAVAGWTPAQRALLAIGAGCDIVLVSSEVSVLPEMYDAVLSAAQSDPGFAAKVDAAARRVVTAKQAGPGAD